MQVKLLNLTSVNYTNNNKQQNKQAAANFALKSNLQKDIFIKEPNLSFKGKSITHDTKENIVDALTAIGFVGAPTALSIGLAYLIAKGQNPEDIFLADGTYYTNAKELSVHSSHFDADSDDGIFKMKNAGINISPERFTYIAADDGIYENPEKGIYIDLLNNKYIDPENGIFVDPDNNITAFADSSGVLNSVVIPDISFGSGYPTCSWDERWQDYTVSHKSEKATMYENIKNTFNNIFHKKSSDGKLKDLLGNEIVNLHDENGMLQTVSVSDDAMELMKKFNFNDRQVLDITNFINSNKLQKYVNDNFDESCFTVNSEFNSVDEFLRNFNSEYKFTDDFTPDMNGDYDTDFDTADTEDSLLGEIIKGVFDDDN